MRFPRRAIIVATPLLVITVGTLAVLQPWSPRGVILLAGSPQIAVTLPQGWTAKANSAVAPTSGVAIYFNGSAHAQCQHRSSSGPESSFAGPSMVRSRRSGW